MLADNPHVFHVHCFAHQLQLVVVAVVKGVLAVGNFFGQLNKIVNMVSSYNMHIFRHCRLSKWSFYMAF